MHKEEVLGQDFVSLILAKDRKKIEKAMEAFLKSGTNYTLETGYTTSGQYKLLVFHYPHFIALIVVLGMALPVLASYIGAIAIVGPILSQMGYQPLVVHFFVFYVATLAVITPPVAMASFTGARIAGAGMMTTAIETSIRGLPLFIIPFAIFKDELLLTVGTPFSTIVIGVAILCAGVFMFTVGLEGYFNHRLKLPERILAVIIGIMIVQPLSDYLTYIFLILGSCLIIYWIPPFFKDRYRKRIQEGGNHDNP